MLNVIADFTNKIEGDLVLQQELYVSYIGVEASLERMTIRGNAVAQKLLEAFQERFRTTADLTLSHLAYIMTPTGLKTFQALPEDGNKRSIKKSLKDKFLEIASSLNIDALGESGKYIPVIFENYISFWNVNEGEDPYAF